MPVAGTSRRREGQRLGSILASGAGKQRRLWGCAWKTDSNIHRLTTHSLNITAAECLNKHITNNAITACSQEGKLTIKHEVCSLAKAVDHVVDIVAPLAKKEVRERGAAGEEKGPRRGCKDVWKSGQARGGVMCARAQ